MKFYTIMSCKTVSSTPSVPNTGFSKMFFKNDGKLYILDDAGTESLVGGSGGSGEVNTASNLGASGEGVFASKVGVDLQFKKLIAGTNISIVGHANDLTISATGGASGEVNTASNVGTGAGQVFKQKTGVDLEMKTIKAGSNISISNDTNEVTISATAGGGETNTASNLGTGEGVFASKVGVDLQMKSLKAGTGMSMTSTGTEITLTSTAGSKEHTTIVDAAGNGDYTTISAAITAGKKALFVKAGVYTEDSISLDGISIQGEGVVGYGSAGGTYIRFSNSTFNGLSAPCTISSCYIDFDSSSGIAALTISGNSTISFTNCLIDFRLDGYPAFSFVYDGDFGSCNFDGCIFTYGNGNSTVQTVFEFKPGSSASTYGNVLFSGCSFDINSNSYSNINLIGNGGTNGTSYLRGIGLVITGCVFNYYARQTIGNEHIMNLYFNGMKTIVNNKFYFKELVTTTNDVVISTGGMCNISNNVFSCDTDNGAKCLSVNQIDVNVDGNVICGFGTAVDVLSSYTTIVGNNLRECTNKINGAGASTITEHNQI